MKQFKKGQVLKFKGESLLIVVEVNESSIEVISTKRAQLLQYGGVTGTIKESEYDLLKSTRLSADAKAEMKAIYDAYVKFQKSSALSKKAQEQENKDKEALVQAFNTFRANNLPVTTDDVFRGNHYTNSAGPLDNGNLYGNFTVTRVAIPYVSDSSPYVYREYDHNLMLETDEQTYKEGSEKYGIQISSIPNEINQMNKIIAKYSDIVKLRSMKPGIDVDGRNLLGTFTASIEVSKDTKVNRYKEFANEFGKVFSDLYQKLYK